MAELPTSITHKAQIASARKLRSEYCELPPSLERIMVWVNLWTFLLAPLGIFTGWFGYILPENPFVRFVMYVLIWFAPIFFASSEENDYERTQLAKFAWEHPGEYVLLELTRKESDGRWGG